MANIRMSSQSYFTLLSSQKSKSQGGSRRLSRCRKMSEMKPRRKRCLGCGNLIGSDKDHDPYCRVNPGFALVIPKGATKMYLDKERKLRVA